MTLAALGFFFFPLPNEPGWLAGGSRDRGCNFRGLQRQCGVSSFMLDSRRVFGPSNQGAGIPHAQDKCPDNREEWNGSQHCWFMVGHLSWAHGCQNTSQIQSLLASHFDKKRSDGRVCPPPNAHTRNANCSVNDLQRRRKPQRN